MDMKLNFTSSFSTVKADAVVELDVDEVADAGVLPNISAVALTACTFGSTNTTAENYVLS